MIIQHNVLKKGRDKESVCLIKRIGDQYSEFGTYLLNDNRERKLMQNYIIMEILKGLTVRYKMDKWRRN